MKMLPLGSKHVTVTSVCRCKSIRFDKKVFLGRSPTVKFLKTMKFLKTWMCVAQTALMLIAIVRFSAADEPVRLHQIQVIGTHNSYHIAPRGAVYEAIAATNATLAGSIDYTHRPLPEQFTQLGIRQIELDVFADPEGGRYAK